MLKPKKIGVVVSRIFICVAFLGFVALILVVLSTFFGPGDRSEIRTRNQLIDLSYRIKLARIKHAIEDQDRIGPMTNREYADLLLQADHNPYSDLSAYLNSDQTLIIDIWGNEVLFLHDGEGKLVVILSYGQNGVWDDGKGDDVIVFVGKH